MVHILHRKKTPGGCIERVARSGSCRDSVRGVVGTMNAAWSRPDWLAIVQSARKQAQLRVCTPGFKSSNSCNIFHSKLNNVILNRYYTATYNISTFIIITSILENNQNNFVTEKHDA